LRVIRCEITYQLSADAAISHVKGSQQNRSSCTCSWRSPFVVADSADGADTVR
jgi:hypothetical protein